MTRDELESLGWSDQELIESVKQIAGGTRSKAKPEKLSGNDTTEKQLARRGMFDIVAAELYSDPVVP